MTSTAASRKIIHVDMDCFYAAVEMLDNPQYRGKPLAVGGSRDNRGVISTCNYEARAFGVRSAMPTSHALRLCPNLLLVPGRMPRYQELSRQIRQIFERYTPIIEPLSLDEAYLDVSQSNDFGGSATLIAEQIRQDIFNETGLTASAGVAPVKFVAKVASDENKPNGLCVIAPQGLDEFVRKMPLGKIPGVGKVTLEKLHHLGLYTCEQVRDYPLERLVKSFGKFGPVLWQRSQGIDERSVSVSRTRKSVGVERTLSEDIHHVEECLAQVDRLFPKLKERLAKVQPDLRVQSQGVKLKFSDFQLTTVEHRFHTLNQDAFADLLREALDRQSGRGIRLVGLVVGLPGSEKSQQLSFAFEPPESDGMSS